MKNTANINIVKKYFNFLTSIRDFKIKEVESRNHALYVKFISSNAGIYFIYEFRDAVPQIQFTRLIGGSLKSRQGLYTIRELYKDENFKLQSFYLDEILSFKGQADYRDYFKNIQTIEEAIKISAELVGNYAMDYVNGDEISYTEIDRWYRTKVSLIVE